MDVILLDDRDGRTVIEIHVGNYVHDTTGCILVGSSRGSDSVNDSKDKLNELIVECRGKSITVQVS